MVQQYGDDASTYSAQIFKSATEIDKMRHDQELAAALHKHRMYNVQAMSQAQISMMYGYGMANMANTVKTQTATTPEPPKVADPTAWQ